MIETHIHKKSGKQYRFLFIANEHATKPGWEEFAVYSSLNGVIYTRPMRIFNDKFEEIK